MRAVIIHAPRDVRVEEAKIPRLQPDDVKVRIQAGGICGSDLHYYLHVGLGGGVPLPVNPLVGKEITLRGTFRFHEEFAWAVDCIASGALDVAPLLTEVLPIEQAVQAFDLAADRTRAMKVQLAF